MLSQAGCCAFSLSSSVKDSLGHDEPGVFRACVCPLMYSCLPLLQISALYPCFKALMLLDWPIIVLSMYPQYRFCYTCHLPALGGVTSFS